MKTSIEITVQGLTSDRPLQLTQSVPDVIDALPNSELESISMSDSKRAESCIYCGSQNQLSKEHVIPYALGGETIIWDGSCEKCRQKTQDFENAVLRGEMQGVRYIQGLPSRSKHANLPSTVSVQVTIEGIQSQIDIPLDEAPIFLTFPLFIGPKYLDPSKGKGLDITGTVSGSYGADPATFMTSIGASSVVMDGARNAPVAFAQMVAKIGYGIAWLQGLLKYVDDPSELVDAFLDNPRNLGRFVGTLPEPYVKHPGYRHRFLVNVQHGLLLCEVQLFADSGAPIYLVALGRLRDGVSLETIRQDVGN